jgi:hypothetical protein
MLKTFCEDDGLHVLAPPLEIAGIAYHSNKASPSAASRGILTSKHLSVRELVPNVGVGDDGVEGLLNPVTKRNHNNALSINAIYSIHEAFLRQGNCTLHIYSHKIPRKSGKLGA